MLHSNGDIMFAYKELPIKITNIAHEEHPVKVGLSVAYIIDRTIFILTVTWLSGPRTAQRLRYLRHLVLGV